MIHFIVSPNLHFYFALSSTIAISSFRQSIQLIDQRVYLPVGGLDLPLQRGLLVRRAGQWELFMQGEHLFHQGDHAIVAGDIGGVGEIYGADREIL